MDQNFTFWVISLEVRGQLREKKITVPSSNLKKINKKKKKNTHLAQCDVAMRLS
jgi:hypothetical protein